MLEISYRKILEIAIPLMFGTFVQSVVMITDNSFIARLDDTIIYNAVNNAGLIYVSLFMFSKGLADGAQIIIARKYGEQNYTQIGQMIFHAQLSQMVLSGFLFLLFFGFGSVFIHSIVKSEATGEQMIIFLKYRSLGIFFAGMYANLSAFLIGIGKTKMVLVSTLAMALSNIFLDYVLIFGKWGFPELGMPGAAIASSASEVISFVIILIYVNSEPSFEYFKIKLFQRFYFKEIKELVKLSVPLMFQGFFALFGWLIFFTLIEREMSAHDLEVSSIMRNVYFLAFIPAFGFGATTRTYVSNLVGQKKLNLIPVVQRKILLLSFLFILAFLAVPVLFSETFISQINPNKLILQDSTRVLHLVSGSILFFSVVTVWYNSVAALGNSTMYFIIESTSIIVYLICCYLFIVTFKWEILWVWTVEYVYFGVIAIMSFLFLRYHRTKYAY